jgi:hypothetical protein
MLKRPLAAHGEGHCEHEPGHAGDRNMHAEPCTYPYILVEGNSMLVR